MDLIKILQEYKWYDGTDEPKHISASQVSKEPLEIWLKEQGYEKNEEKLSDATLGSIVHLGLEKILEDQNLEDVSIEKRSETEHFGWTISGKPDLVDHKNKVIWDFKTGKNYTKKMMAKDGKNHNYAIQLAVYNMLLGGGYTAKICWFMKDSQAAKSEPVIFSQDIEIMTPFEVLEVIKEKINILEAYGDNMPVKCKDLWARNINKVLVNTKCKFYCSYSGSCPHNKPSVRDITSTW